MNIRWWFLGVVLGNYAMQSQDSLELVGNADKLRDTLGSCGVPPYQVIEAITHFKTWIDAPTESQRLTLNGCLSLCYSRTNRQNLACTVFENLCENVGRDFEALTKISENFYVGLLRLPCVSHSRVCLARMLSYHKTHLEKLESILDKIRIEQLNESDHAIFSYLKGTCFYQHYKRLQRSINFSEPEDQKLSFADLLKCKIRLRLTVAKALNELKVAVDDANPLDMAEMGLANLRIAFLSKNHIEKKQRLTRAIFLLARNADCADAYMLAKSQLADMLYNGLGGEANLDLARILLLESLQYWENLTENHVYFDEKSEGEHKAEACRQFTFLCGDSNNPAHYVLVLPLLEKLGAEGHFLDASDDFKKWAFRWLMNDVLGLGKLGKSTCNYEAARKKLEEFLGLKWPNKPFSDILFAQRHLAQLYCEGLGGPQDLVKARPLLETIMRYPDQWQWSQAYAYLRHIYENGIGGSQKRQRAATITHQQLISADDVQPFIG